MRKNPLIPGVLLTLAALFAIFSIADKTRIKEPDRVYKTNEVGPVWSREVIDTFEHVPKTDDGRTKSLYTFAYYELLRNRAYAGLTIKVESGQGGDAKPDSRTVTPVSWLLDALFFPEAANRYPIFNVEDSDALLQLGLNPHDKKRDKYAYEELAPAREAIYAANERLRNVESDKRNRLDNLIQNLSTNFILYERIIHYLNFARDGVQVPADFADEPLKSKAGQTVPLTEAIEGFKNSRTFQDFRVSNSNSQVPMPEMLTRIDNILKSGDSSGIAWFAPSTNGGTDWVPAAALIRDSLIDGPHSAHALNDLKSLENLTRLAADPVNDKEFQSQLNSFGQGLIQAAEKTGTYSKVPLDLGYLKAGLFSKAKWTFLLLFIVLAISWLAPESKTSRVLSRIAFWGAAAALLMIVSGIGWRVRITGFGPITNIYETIPYITLMAGLFALGLEVVFKNRIPLIIAITCGAAGMFLAGRYEAGDAADTMPSLVAVLRSNYWLWTHVTTINLGYATVMLASIFSMVYIFCRMFDITRQNKALFRMLTQSTYGILCFGLFFSLIGTILGGIWGNESWGRFWGWDPKENGALLIVLWCLAILHMRLAGWIREFGLHLCSVFAANFCLFSWWHVNLLGIGLHSYGFTQGLDVKLYIAYSLVCVVVLLGAVIWFLEKLARKQATPPAGTPLPEKSGPGPSPAVAQ